MTANKWNDQEAAVFADDPLAMRVYTSRLLGQDPSLVLHGGGNTSVKIREDDFFGTPTDLLYVKGSGWDLATIEKPGFSPVRLDVLLQLATFESLSDSVIVREQRAALTDPFAPNPSVEAILHAVIPAQFVDHTHADAVVAVMNTPGGLENVKAIYGDRVLIIPYVMPGFKLARLVYEMTRATDWDAIEGLVLMNHGVFTFHDDARTSYERMIKLVSEAENFLAQQQALAVATTDPAPPDLLRLAELRRAVSRTAGQPMLARLDRRPEAAGYAGLPTLAEIAFQGPLTPDHIIRTKRIPVQVGDDVNADVAAFAADYAAYFEAHATDDLTMLDPAPRWGVWPGQGVVSFGATLKAATITADIIEHTIAAQQWAASLGGWQALGQPDLFDMEYWELEQAKLKRGGGAPPFQGKVALVTGAASGIGRACAQVLHEQGAVVVGLDLSDAITAVMNQPGMLGLKVDVTDAAAVQSAIDQTILAFGGLDVLVTNAGFFPKNAHIEAMEAATWDKSVAVNLTSHQRMMQATIPYLKRGIDPAVVVVGSKNFPAPGPGAASYSVMKAGLTQLARVAALELAADGVRVNVVHPDAVFDTGIWTDEMLASRAGHYGMSVSDYKTKNLLGTEITSRDVATLVALMAGEAFGKTTGAQVPIDGGNNRVI
jgi:rhamnose utilization protein RhaD (predicted bifunctional aldolase and dehydrogenase)/NAD(P)-dependent dehydrogenase (short-subunit alcohol dehydrogenase family)